MADLVSMNLNIDLRELQRLRSAHVDKANNALKAAAIEGVTIVKMSMENSPPGNTTYRRGNKTHTASSPGNAPRVDMGTLVNSIKWENAGRLRYIVSDGVVYGVYLEFGTEKMAARPFMSPMLDELKKKIPIIFDNYLYK